MQHIFTQKKKQYFYFIFKFYKHSFRMQTSLTLFYILVTVYQTVASIRQYTNNNYFT